MVLPSGTAMGERRWTSEDCLALVPLKAVTDMAEKTSGSQPMGLSNNFGEYVRDCV